MSKRIDRAFIAATLAASVAVIFIPMSEAPPKIPTPGAYVWADNILHAKACPVMDSLASAVNDCVVFDWSVVNIPSGSYSMREPIVFHKGRKGVTVNFNGSTLSYAGAKYMIFVE